MRKETQKLPKIVVILGPTACGKTEWSLRLAKKFDAQVISADSRQVYQKMNIGTNKPEGEWVRKSLTRNFTVEGINHYLMDFLDPGERFTVASFRDTSLVVAKRLIRQNILPIISGGTGMYISSVVDNWQIPRVPANKKLRRSLAEKSPKELMQLLWSLDPVTAKKIDSHNQLRIIRALEVCIFTGEPLSNQQTKGDPIFDALQIGIEVPRETLYHRIDKRIDSMMENGLLEEVTALVNQRYGWNMPSMSGIGYRQFKPYFEGTASLEEVVEVLKRDTKHYARRQLTWFRRDPRIVWCKRYTQAEKQVQKFLS